MHTNTFSVLQDANHYNCTLLGNDPPSIITHSSGFVSRPAFVPEDGKTNHRLISLRKIHLKRLHSCNGGKIVPT